MTAYGEGGRTAGPSSSVAVHLCLFVRFLALPLTGEFFLYVRAGPGGLPLASLPLSFASAFASWFCLFPFASPGPDLGVWAYKKRRIIP